MDFNQFANEAVKKMCVYCGNCSISNKYFDGVFMYMENSSMGIHLRDSGCHYFSLEVVVHDTLCTTTLDRIVILDFLNKMSRNYPFFSIYLNKNDNIAITFSVIEVGNHDVDRIVNNYKIFDNIIKSELYTKITTFITSVILV